MFISIQLILAATVLVSGADTAKKKAVPTDAPTAPAVPSPTPAVDKGVPAGTLAINLPASRAPAPASSSPRSRTPLLGKVIGQQLASAAHAVAPHAAYLSNMLSRRTVGGPPLPPNIRANPNAVAIHADSIVVE